MLLLYVANVAEQRGEMQDSIAISSIIQRYEQLARLPSEDHALLRRAAAGCRRVLQGSVLIEEGDTPQSCFVVLSGWLCQYKQLRDGRRQIVALLLPGDICNPGCSMMRKADCAVSALTTATVMEMSRSTLATLESDHPNLATVFHSQSASFGAMQREWTQNIGHRTALERVAHLFCELYTRLEATGLAANHQFMMPLTQSELGMTLALSVVHVNRTLSQLRERGLISLRLRQAKIPCFESLAMLAQFDGFYLH